MTNRNWMIIAPLSLAAVLSPLSQAQTGLVAGPGSGFVFDKGAQTVRPIRGIPGAATIGDSIDAGYKFAAAYVAPGLDSMFGVEPGGAVHFYRAGGGSMTEVALDGTLIAPERIVFSPSGTAAALIGSGQVQIVKGLPGSPSVPAAFNLAHSPRMAKPAMTSMAVSDDGVDLLFVAGGSLQLANAAEGSRTLLSPGVGAMAAFAPGARDAAVVSRDGGVILIRDVANAAAQQTLAPGDAAFASIAGLAFSADGANLIISSASQNSVITLDAASGSRRDITCSCAVTSLTRMGGSYRLTEFSADPLWLFDASSATPRIVFVPALKAGL